MLKIFVYLNLFELFKNKALQKILGCLGSPSQQVDVCLCTCANMFTCKYTVLPVTESLLSFFSGPPSKKATTASLVFCQHVDDVNSISPILF